MSKPPTPVADLFDPVSADVTPAGQLLAGVRWVIDELREHVPDGCAGPDGNARQGACHECRNAEQLEGLVEAYEAATGPRVLHPHDHSRELT